MKKDNSQGYMLVTEAIAQPDLKKQLLQNAIDEIEYWSEQYKTLRELTPIFKAVQFVKKRVGKVKK